MKTKKYLISFIRLKQAKNVIVNNGTKINFIVFCSPMRGNITIFVNRINAILKKNRNERNKGDNLFHPLLRVLYLEIKIEPRISAIKPQIEREII
jgi:hypothetical protein